MTRITGEAPLPWKYVGGGVVEDANGLRVLHLDMRFIKRVGAISNDGGYPAGEDLVSRVNLYDDVVASLIEADKDLDTTHTLLTKIVNLSEELVAALQAAYDHLSDVVPEDEPLVVQISAALAKARGNES